MHGMNLLKWLGAGMLATVACAAPLREPDHRLLYPHGALIHLSRSGDTLLAFSGWTRGYGIMRFGVGDPAQPRFKSGLALPGYVNRPVRQGDAMYIPSLFGLFVLDTSDADLKLARNLLLNFSPKSGPGRRALVAGDKLLVFGNAANRLFDISDPLAPRLENYGFAPGIKNIFSNGDRFFRFHGVAIEELAPTGETTELATLPGAIRSVMPLGTPAQDKFLVLDRKQGLALYRLEGGQLTEMARMDGVKGLRKTRGGIFLETGDRLLLLGDVDAGRLEVAQEYPLPPGSANLEFDGKNFYVMGSDYNRTIDILDATSPTLDRVATIPICRSDGDLEVADRALYLGSGNRLLAFDRTRQGALAAADALLDVDFEHVPNPQQSSKSFGAYNLLSSYGMRRFGNYLLFSGALIDIRKPLAPELVGIVTAPHLGVSTDGARAAFAQGDRITIADMSALPEFKTLGVYACAEDEGPILDVVLRGERLYAIDTRRFYAFDVSDPANIRRIDAQEADSPCALALVGERLYVPSGIVSREPRLAIYHTQRRSVTWAEGLIQEGVSALAIKGQTLFLGDGTLVRQFDLTDPDRPAPVAVYTAQRSGEPPDQRTNFTRIQVDGDWLHARKYSSVNSWKIAGKGED